MFDWLKEALGFKKFICAKCGTEMKANGNWADLYTPPDYHGKHKHYEICPKCFRDYEKTLKHK
jgi:hypothetical protein